MKLVLCLVILAASTLLSNAEETAEEQETLERRGIRYRASYFRRYKGPCGIRHNPKKKKSLSFSKIVGGRVARFGEFPWQVAMYTKSTLERGGGVDCGAVIIDEMHLLTAAHCVAANGPCYNAPTKKRFLELFNQTSTPTAHKMFSYHIEDYRKCQWMNPRDLIIFAGLADMTDITSMRVIGTQERAVSKIVVPEEFYGEAQNDIAVLTLSRPLIFTGLVRPACLPSPDLQLKPGRPLTVTGFGTLSYGGESSNHLMKAKLHFYPTEECHEMYEGTFKKFCAGIKEGGVDSCQGDSGGPIGIDRRREGEEQFTVVGLVSYGYYCAEPDTPGAYADLRYFLDFIERARQNTKKPVSPWGLLKT